MDGTGVAHGNEDGTGVTLGQAVSGGDALEGPLWGYAPESVQEREIRVRVAVLCAARPM